MDIAKLTYLHRESNANLTIDYSRNVNLLLISESSQPKTNFEITELKPGLETRRLKYPVIENMKGKSYEIRDTTK